MVVCPACGSSRIRHDYRPAPFYLRIFLIRGLLCDHCNRQFRAFSLRMPSSRPPSHLKKRAETFLTPSGSVKPTGEGAVGVEVPLREQIGRRQVSAVPPVETPASTLRQDSEVSPAALPASGVSCPECGSERVKRRPRKAIERLIFTFTNHKAYVCRECQSSFYHRPEA